MEFRTQVPIRAFENPLDYTSRIVSIGSCFAVNIAEKLNYFQFQNSVNPFGILFHPAAIEKFIGYVAQQKIFTRDDIFFHNERWQCFDAHSGLSDSDENVVLNRLTEAVANSAAEFTRATHLIITLGTAWAYREVESGQIVANCHKVPQHRFTKDLQPVSAIVESLKNSITAIQSINPALNIIFTVSPVRHIKDGFVENQRSKSHLLTAVHEVVDHELANYFPSYEIIMDELRDYRFYMSDMLHPNQTAIDYVWERFSANYISSEAAVTMNAIEVIRSGLAHRPFNPESDEHKRFTDTLSFKISNLQRKYPHIVF